MPYSARAAQQRRIVAAALPHFGLADASYQLLKLGPTATFRVVSATGEASAVRVQPLARMPLRLVESELAWLRDLHQQGVLRVPVPLPALNGAFAVLLPATPTDAAQMVTRFAWLAGQHKRRLTVRDAEGIGIMLHRASSTYQPPPTFERWHMDGAAFREQLRVFAETDVPWLTPAIRHVVAAATQFVEAMLPILDSESHSYGLIHGDPNLTNWLFHADGVALLDFESCCYSYYLFDVGRVLHELARDPRSGPALMLAFQRGYTRIRPLPPLPDAQVRAGMLMSLLDTVSWVGTLDPDFQRTWGVTLATNAVIQIQQILAQPPRVYQ